jgi:Flp pilus assembly pilin Flp
VKTINPIASAAGRLWLRARHGRSGQAYTEYGMLLVFIGIALITSLTFMGGTVHNLFQNVSVNIQH